MKSLQNEIYSFFLLPAHYALVPIALFSKKVKKLSAIRIVNSFTFRF